MGRSEHFADVGNAPREKQHLHHTARGRKNLKHRRNAEDPLAAAMPSKLRSDAAQHGPLNQGPNVADVAEAYDIMTGKVCPPKEGQPVISVTDTTDSAEVSGLMPGFVAPPPTPLEALGDYVHPMDHFDILHASELPPLSEPLLSPGTRLELMERKSRRRSIFIGTGLLLLAASLAGVSEIRHRVHFAFLNSHDAATEGPDFAVDGSGKIHDLHHRVEELQHNVRHAAHEVHARSEQGAKQAARDLRGSASRASSRAQTKLRDAHDTIKTESQSFMDKLHEITSGRTPPRLQAERRARSAAGAYAVKRAFHHANEANPPDRAAFEKLDGSENEWKESTDHALGGEHAPARGFVQGASQALRDLFSTAKLFAVDAFGEYPDMIGDLYDDIEEKAEHIKAEAEQNAAPFLDKVKRMFASPRELDNLKAQAQHELQGKLHQAASAAENIYEEAKHKLSEADIREKLDEMFEAPGEIRHSLKHAAHEAIDAVQDTAGRLRNRAHAAFDDVSAKAEDHAHHLKGDLKDDARDLYHGVQRKAAERIHHFRANIDEASTHGADLRHEAGRRLKNIKQNVEKAFGDAKEAIEDSSVAEKLEEMFEGPGEIRQTIHDAYDKAAEKLNDLREHAEDVILGTNKRFMDNTRRARADARDAYDHASSKFRDAREAAEDMVDDVTVKMQDRAHHLKGDLKDDARDLYHGVQRKAAERIHHFRANIDEASTHGADLRHEAGRRLKNIKQNVEKAFGDAKEAIEDSSVAEKLEEMFEGPGEIRQTIHDAYDKAAEKLNDLRERADSGFEDLKQGVESVKSNLASESGDVKSKLREAANDLKERLTSAPRAEDVLGTRAFDDERYSSEKPQVDEEAVRPYGLLQSIVSSVRGILSNADIVAKDAKAEVQRNAARLSDALKAPAHHRRGRHAHRHNLGVRDSAFRAYHHVAHKTLATHDPHYDAEHTYTELMNEHTNAPHAAPSLFERLFGLADEPVCKLKASDGWRQLRREHAEGLGLGPHQLANLTRAHP